MAARVYSNNVSTKLTAQLLAAGTTANVTAGDGALFAGADGSDWIIGTLRRMSGFRDVAREIVKITNRSTDALTIVRAQEGTTALQFEIGDQLDIDLTAATFTDLVASVLANPMTTGGDLIYGGASGVPTRLANGSAGQVLTSGGTTVAPTWETPAAGGDAYVTAAAIHTLNLSFGVF